jgi:methionyl aminopeptidase
MRTVPKSIARPDYVESGIPKGERRLNRSKIDILEQQGQEAMRKVCRLAREVAAEVRPSIITDYLDEVCHKACIERNASATLIYAIPFIKVSNCYSRTRLP